MTYPEIFVHGEDRVRGARNHTLRGVTHTTIDQHPYVKQQVAKEIVDAHTAATHKALYDYAMNPFTPFGALANFWKQRNAEYLAGQQK